MREIKFRAWLVGGGRWATISDIESLALINPETQPGGKFHLQSEAVDNSALIYMQFTGLTDKNGTEIYEGDVLRCYDYYDEAELDLCVFADRQVGWGDDYPAWTLRPVVEYLEWNSLQHYAEVRPDGECCEVIGNIHEHSELLEAK